MLISKVKSPTAIIVLLHLIIGVGFLSCGKITAPADTEPPRTPANFTLFGGGDGQASFRWTRNTESDFANYIVYRAVDSPENFTKIAETTENEFVDQFLDYERVYYYYLTAIDFAGNESAPTPILDVRPVNVSSPSVPTNVIVFGHNYPNLNQVELKISWNPPAASDLWKYFIYKSDQPAFDVSESTLLDSTTVSIYFDRDVKPGDTFYYRIAAMDLGRRVGIPSTAASDVVLQKVILESPSNRIQFSSPYKFSWFPVDKAVNYQVFVAKSPLADVVWTSAKVTDTSLFYNGNVLTPGALYYWWVGAYSKNTFVDENGTTVNPDVNSRSDIWTFFVR